MTIVDTGVSVVEIVQLDEIDYHQCLALNMGERGLMKRTLVSCRDGYTEGKAIMLKIDDKIVAWCLMFQGYSGETAYFYTDPSFRKKGFGKTLANVAYSINPQVEVIPWDETSNIFFSKTQFDNVRSYV